MSIPVITDEDYPKEEYSHQFRGLDEPEVDRIKELETALTAANAEVERLRAGGMELSAAISEIDALLDEFHGHGNEMRVSGYDLHCDPQVVVNRVRETLSDVGRGERADSERLDWLFTKVKRMWVGDTFPTTREAIDAAIEKEAKHG